jgi:hypothetical protein
LLVKAASSRGGRSQVVRLQPDHSIHLEVSGLDRERRLHAGRLLDASDDIGYRVRFEQAELEILQGDVLQVYFDWERTFTKQLVHAQERGGGEREICLDLRPIGEPVSAEARECYRVSARAANVMAHLGDSPACEVVDVSASGFSVYTREELQPGHALRATLLHEGSTIEGLVRVRNLRRTRSGRLRCGVSCIDDNGNSGLGRALSRINLALQRAQLARRSEEMCTLPRPRFIPRRLAR